MDVREINDVLYYFNPNGLVYSASGDNANCTISACPVELTVYGYRPSIAGSGAAIALYTICIVFNLLFGFKYKTWGFMTTMITGCVVEILGYVGRILYWQNPWKQAGFIMQIVLITIGPVFFCAAIYVMIYKIIIYIDNSRARFNPKIIYWTFITFDLISLVLQAVGGAMSSTSNGASTVGVNIALAGLSIQVITLFVFCALCIDYTIRSRNTYKEYPLSLRFKAFTGFLILAIVTIFARCCYRVYELSEGYSRDSTALRDQPMFNALELSMIVIAAFALIVAHPGPVFYSKKGVEESPAERRRIASEEKIEQVVGVSDSE